MNERPSDSSGLPLRAMVMVLLFLGVVFLLVGFQAMGSGDDSSADDSPVATVSTTVDAVANVCVTRAGRQGRCAGLQHLGD